MCTNYEHVYSYMVNVKVVKYINFCDTEKYNYLCACCRDNIRKVDLL